MAFSLAATRRLPLLFEIKKSESHDRAVQQHSQVLARTAVLGADLVLVPLIDEEIDEESSIFFIQLGQRSPDELPLLALHQQMFGVEIEGWDVHTVVIELILPHDRAAAFLHDVRADLKNESA